MRGCIIVVLAIALMAFGGWLVIDFGDGSTTVEIRTDKIKEDAGRAIDKAGEFADQIRSEGESSDSVPDTQ